MAEMLRMKPNSVSEAAVAVVMAVVSLSLSARRKVDPT
jgi:hypothetical protein